MWSLSSIKPSPLSRHPRGVELAEVDGCGDDDRAAGDGRDSGLHAFAAATAVSEGASELYCSPDHEEPSEERHAARHERDDFCKHVIASFASLAPGRKGRLALRGKIWMRSARALLCVLTAAAASRVEARSGRVACALPPSPWLSLDHLPHPRRIRAEVEGLGVYGPLVPGLDLGPSRMLRGVVFVVLERVGSRDEQQGLPPGEASHLVGEHERSLEDRSVHGGRLVLPLRVVEGEGGDGLVSQHLRDLLVGAEQRRPQEQRRVATGPDGQRLLLAVGALQLLEGLQDHGHRDVPASDDRDEPVYVGKLADVRELVEDQVHGRGKLAAVVDDRRIAELVHRLPHEHGEQEVEGPAGVRHRREHDRLLPGVPHGVEVQLVVRQDVLHVVGHHGQASRVAADDDRLQGLSGRGLEALVRVEGEVLRLVRWFPYLLPAHRGGSVRERPGVLVEGLLVLGGDQSLARLQLVEEQVERAHVRLVALSCFCQGEERQHPGEAAVLGRAVVDEVGDEGGVEQALGVLPERVARVLGVAGGVGDEAFDDCEHVDVAPHVGQRVVVA